MPNLPNNTTLNKLTFVLRQMRKHRQSLVHRRINLLLTAAAAAITALSLAVGLGLATCFLAIGTCSLAISTFATALIFSTSSSSALITPTGGSLGSPLGLLQRPTLGLGHLGLLGRNDEALRRGLLLLFGLGVAAAGRWCCCVGHGK